MRIYKANPYILISAHRAKTLKPGWRKPMPVLVQINGKPLVPWRINMMPIGDGSFYLYLHGEVRRASKTKVGNRVEVCVQFDGKYKNGPMHPMTKELRNVLAKNPGAKKSWDALIPSRKKEILRYFYGLKSDEARARNIKKVLHVLSGQPGRFMARSWTNGS